MFVVCQNLFLAYVSLTFVVSPFWDNCTSFLSSLMELSCGPIQDYNETITERPYCETTVIGYVNNTYCVCKTEVNVTSYRN